MSFTTFTAHQMYDNLNDQVKEDELGRACTMHGREDECLQGFGCKTRMEETTSKTLM
jgi:hypothetical protein